MFPLLRSASGSDIPTCPMPPQASETRASYDTAGEYMNAPAAFRLLPLCTRHWVRSASLYGSIPRYIHALRCFLATHPIGAARPGIRDPQQHS